MESGNAKQSFDDAAVPEDNATERDVEPKTIIVKGINEMTTSDTIRYFIEAMTKEKVLGVASFGKRNALVTLENLSDFSEVKQRVEEETLDNKQLTIIHSPLSSTILVSGLTPDTTTDALKFMFSSKAGGKVSHVLLHEDKSHAIVTFEDSSVIKKIIENTWKLNNAVLKVDTTFFERTFERNQNYPVELAPTATQSAGSFQPCSDYGRFQKFLNESSVSSETFLCQHKGFRRYILEHRKDELEKLKIELNEYCVAIETAQADDELLISGTEIGLDCVRKALQRMINSITVKEMTIHQSGLKKIFASDKGNSLVEAIEQEFHCSIEHEFLPGIPETDQEDFESSDESFKESDDEEQISSPPRLYVSSAGNEKISCYNVDITWKTGNIVLENADILVSSNTGQLHNTFRSAAGQELLREDSIEFGGIQVTPGYNLPCKYVIHTRCPRWDGPNGPAEMALRSIVQKCLQEALQLNATSIAFPIIGTGGLRFDQYTACRIMITEVISVTCGWGRTSLTDIRFVVFHKDKSLANAILFEFLDVSGQSYEEDASGGAVFIRRGNSATLLGWPFGYGYKLYRFLTKPVPYNIQFSYALGSTTNMYGNVEVHVLHGDPQEFVYEKSDAIVNFFYIFKRHNELTRIIRRVAGPALHEQLENLSQQTPGSALVTESGSLNAQRIIHIIVGQNPDVQTIQRYIEECFQVADQAGCQFISMPFKVKYFKNVLDGELAQVTFKTLATMCQSLQNLRRIRMVVFNKEEVPVFQQMQQYYGSGVVKRPNDERIPSDSSHSWPSSDTTASKATFQLIGENSSVEDAKSALEEGISESYEARQIVSEYVSNLDGKQRRMLTTKARELDVTIKCSEEPNVLVIQGDREDVDAIDATLKKEIDEMVLYDSIRWQYQFHDDDAQYFDRKSNSTIEKANGSEEESRATVRIEGEAFDIDLEHSTAIGQDTGRKISIKRTPLEGFPIPAKWSPMPLENGKEKTVHLVTLSTDSHEYKNVLTLFGRASDPRFPAYFELPELFIKSCRQIKIQRIQSPHLYQQYIAYKKKMEKDNGRKFNERRLFHGTTERNVKAINTQGFNRTFCGANGTLLGKGVYFAESSMYSAAFTAPNQNNERCIYLARVLTGHYRRGHSEMKVPPCKYHGTPEMLYDSVANTDGPNPDIFAVFHDSQCYPEYLITFVVL